MTNNNTKNKQTHDINMKFWMSIVTWTYLFIFRGYVFASPKFKDILIKYDSGNKTSARQISIMSTPILWLFLILLWLKDPSWIQQKIVAVILLLPTLFILGWFCLRKKQEIKQYNN